MINEEARKEGTNHVSTTTRRDIHQTGVGLDLESNVDPASSMNMWKKYARIRENIKYNMFC